MTACTRSIAVLALTCMGSFSAIAEQGRELPVATTPVLTAQLAARVSALPRVPIVMPPEADSRNFDGRPADVRPDRLSGSRLHTPNAVTIAVRNDPTDLRTTTCQHAITINDSYGDGWTGGYLDVYVDSVLTLGGLTLAGGFGPETVYFDVADGVTITTVWTSGDYPSEASYCIYNARNEVSGCDGTAGAVPTGITVIADCQRTGACCNPYDGTCADDVDVDNCLAPSVFTLGVSCANLAVPCGDPGVCCNDATGTCTQEFRLNCAGRFIAGGTCDDFDPPCGDYQPCPHTIVIRSSNRNDWNNGHSTVDVYVDGVPVLSGLTIRYGEPLEQRYTFLASDGSVITTVFNWASGWTEPINAEYCIYDASDNLLGCDGLNSTLPTGITVAGVCQGTGACCNPYDGTCEDNVSPTACLPPLRYTANVTCANLPEPCGNPGACCDQEAGTCTEEFELNCAGRFEAGATCGDDPFTPPCGVYGVMKVLIVPAETEAEYLASDGAVGFMTRLAALTFSDVDYMDGTVVTPTLAELLDYDMVITYADTAYADKYAMGDVLADYVDAGGRVIIGNYAGYTQGNLTWLDGRIMQQYNPAIVKAPSNYGVTYQEDGTDCIFDNVNAFYMLGSDVIRDVQGPAFVDGTYYDPDPWAAQTYAPVAAIRYDRTVTYVSGHTAGYVVFQEQDRQELAQLTANIGFCEPDATLLGACCNPIDGICTDNVSVVDCMPPLQWHYNATCAEIPPCGNPGACCDDVAGTCMEAFEYNCTGRFIPGETCATAVFDPPCGQHNVYKVLYCPSSDDSPEFRSGLAEVLNSDVDYLNTRYVTPTLAELLQYQAVIHWVDYPHADAVAMGDVLADYVDAGGRVILGLWSMSGAGQYNYLQGRLATDYNPVYIEGMDWQGGDYVGDEIDCIHDGITFYGTPWRDLVTDVTPMAWYDGSLLDKYGDTSIAVAYLLDRSVYYISGFDGGTSGPGQWVDLVANIVRCPGTDVYGACCNPADGTCTDNVRKQDCQPPLQWTYNTTCAELDPGCGWPGVCCDETTGTCVETVFAQCNGRFVPGETCATAVFDPPCGQYDGCQHSITLYDENPPQYGWFGWIDASVDVYVGGLPRYMGLTMAADEGEKTLYFAAAPGEAITTVWHPGWLDGAWDHLAAYCIHGLDGTTLACDGLGSDSRPEGITVSGSCTPLVCGDGNCQLEGGESCANCPGDCGACRCPSQPMAGGPAYFCDLDCDLCDAVQILADNFNIYEPTTVLTVRFWGAYLPGDAVPASDAFTVTIRDSLGSYPGKEVVIVGPTAGTRRMINADLYEYTVAIDATLEAGTYWIEIYNDTAGSTETWGWYDGTTDPQFGAANAAYTTAVPEDWSLGAFDMSFELECSTGASVVGDMNGDDVVDFVDYELFTACLSGPSVPFAGGCDAADLDTDGDVDLADMALFAHAFGTGQ